MNMAFMAVLLHLCHLQYWHFRVKEVMHNTINRSYFILV